MSIRRILRTASVAALAALVLFGCSSSGKRRDVELGGPSPREKQLTNELLVKVEKHDFESALVTAKTFKQEFAVSTYSTTVGYYEAFSLENLGRFEEAVAVYREVVNLTSGKTPTLEAQALYHLGICHEALDDLPRTLASLLDAERRDRHLPEEVERVELPARLASTYARMSNEAMATKYYQKAERSLSQLVRKFEEGKYPEWYPRTLYNMGRMSIRKMAESDFEMGLKPVEKSQIWLLRSAEKGHPLWSRKASEQLIQIYREAWTLIQSVPLADGGDRLVGLKEQQNKMISMGSVIQSLISRLKLERLPESDEGSSHYVSDIFNYLGELEKRVSTLLESRPLETVPTAETLRREGIRRGGVVVSDETILEKQSKAPAKQAPATAPSVVPAPTGTKDPNL